MSAPSDLTPALAVEQIGDTDFVGTPADYDGRAFGGELLAKSVMAASRTCAGRCFHSLHGYFLRAVRPGVPARFRVTALRDGRRLAIRRIAVEQDGKLSGEWTASFTAVVEGLAYQDHALPADVPLPEALPPIEEIAAQQGWDLHPERPIENRPVGKVWEPAVRGEEPVFAVWYRLRVPLRKDPLLHAAAMAYMSDFASLSALERRFGPSFDRTQSASIDHAFWLHQPVLWDGWILGITRSKRAHAGRALSERHLYAPDGTLVASMSQEAVIGLTGQRSVHAEQ
jgi:acyl-CoA thioesterase-2